MSAEKTSLELHKRIHELIQKGWPKTRIERELGISRNTIQKYAQTPLPPETDPVEEIPDGLPEPIKKRRGSVLVDTVGVTLLMSDIHIPHHDKAAIEVAVKEGKRRKANVIILNGDILDCYSISRFDKDPSHPKLLEEIRMGQQLFKYLRAQFPSARIIWKEGNHEERFGMFIRNNAPALFGFPCLAWESLLNVEAYGVEFVGDKARIDLGKLAVFHGHEFQGGTCAPANAARTLFLRAKCNAICGHHHTSSSNREKTAKGKQIATWTVACLCDLNPQWNSVNRWDHGFATIENHTGGGFSVQNSVVFEGQLQG